MTQSPGFGLPWAVPVRDLNSPCWTPHSPRARAIHLSRGTPGTPAEAQAQVANIAHQSFAPRLYLSHCASRVPTSALASVAIFARTGLVGVVEVQVPGTAEITVCVQPWD